MPSASKRSDNSHSEHEFEEMENSIAYASDVIQNEEKKKIKIEMPQIESCENMEYITEKELLQNLIKNYKQREISLERKLIELNRLKEEKFVISELKMQLEKKRAKLKSLEETIASFRFESKIIKEKIEEDIMCKMQLEIANKIINEMESKKDMIGSHVKDQMLMLQQQVDEFEKYNVATATVNKEHEHVEDRELEVLEMKRRNKELELEKREVGTKLATALARNKSEETKVIQIQEEINDLQHVHEQLSEQVEILQRNRFDLVQELVYQRWLFICLRYEVNNHNKKQIRKATRQDCTKILGKELLHDNKAHSFASDSEHDTVSSNATFDDFDEIETTTLESSSSSQSNSSSNSSLLNKLKRWKKSKYYNEKSSQKGGNRPSRPGLIRRFSMSMVESNLSKPKNSCAGGDSPFMNLEKPPTRLKRVSFSDSVKKSTYHVMQEEVEDVTDENETNSDLNSTITCLELKEHKEEEQYDDEMSNSYENVVCNHEKVDSSAENEGSNIKDQIGCSDDRIKSLLVQLLVYFFLLLVLLAYFRIN
ncbi:hypothetical protein MtrunA17_Chr2g0307341 [Medicago truncatula]|uniref:Transmembrane protein n=1 Tax=Medicago truncatula TaxID=3880 RepID=A0A396JGG7_MEDTR|nr:hypothetical protein MtrunA17_Chr2g0307341 [Medicago truncatula]